MLSGLGSTWRSSWLTLTSVLPNALKALTAHGVITAGMVSTSNTTTSWVKKTTGPRPAGAAQDPADRQRNQVSQQQRDDHRRDDPARPDQQPDAADQQADDHKLLDEGFQRFLIGPNVKREVTGFHRAVHELIRAQCTTPASSRGQ